VFSGLLVVGGCSLVYFGGYVVALLVAVCALVVWLLVCQFGFGLWCLAVVLFAFAGLSRFASFVWFGFCFGARWFLWFVCIFG